MTGCKHFKIQVRIFGEAGEEAEFDQRVAADAGVGGASGEMFGAVIGDDFAFVFAGAVENTEGDAGVAAKHGGGGDVLFGVGTETAVIRAAGIFAVAAPNAHGGADNVVPRVFQEQRRDRRIDAAAQTDKNFHVKMCWEL